MAMSDPLGDMLTRIRNAQMARQKDVACIWSRQHENVCQVLKDEGFICGYRGEEIGGNKKQLVVELKYNEEDGIIQKIERVSRPGRRTYSKAADMTPFYNGLGIKIVSTSQGVMTDHKARQNNIGGEVLCQVF